MLESGVRAEDKEPRKDVRPRVTGRACAVAGWREELQRIHRGSPLGALADTTQPGHAGGPTRGNRPSVQPVALAEEKRWATARDALGLAGLANRRSCPIFVLRSRALTIEFL